MTDRGVFNPLRWPAERKAAVIRLAILAASGLVAVLAGFKLLAPAAAGQWVQRWGYAAIAVTFLLWAVALARAGAPALWLAWLRTRSGVLTLSVALALSVVAGVTTKWGYKVLYDEVVLQGTAMSMAREQRVGAIGRAYVMDDQLRIVQDYLDKRPVFFPFVVSVLHQATGYREANAFVLNFLLMPVILLMVAAAGRRLAGPAAGWVALVSLGAFPLMAINATGAGMELLNLALVLGVVLAGAWYLEQPGERRLDVLVLTAVLLANTRYESSMYVLCAALIVLEGWRRARRVWLSPLALISPLLLIPYAVHNTYLSGTPVLWELRDGQAHRFSFEYLAANLGFAKTFFGNTGPAIANSPWLTWAGLASVLGWAAHRLRWRRRGADVPAAEWSVVAVGLGVAGNLALLLAYYWGDLSDPIVSRLSLPLHALLALAIGAAVAWLVTRGVRWGPGAAVAAALLGYMAWGLPANAHIPGLNLIGSAQDWEESVVARRPPLNRLIITEKSPLFWFCREVSATSTRRVRQLPETLAYHWKQRSFDEVLVMQRLAPATAGGGMGVEPDSQLPEGVILETIAERRVGGKLQRVSLVRDVRWEPAPPADDQSPSHE